MDSIDDNRVKLIVGSVAPPGCEVRLFTRRILLVTSVGIKRSNYNFSIHHL